MKHVFLRRFGALVLALAMALSLTVTPAWAAPGEGGTSIQITADQFTDGYYDNATDTLQIKSGGTAKLKIEFAGQDWNAGAGTLTWTSSSVVTSSLTFNPVSGDSFETTMTAPAQAGDYLVTATLVNKTDNTDVVTDTMKESVTSAAANVPVTGVSLDPAALTLRAGESGLLTATVEPANASSKELAWESSDPTVAAVTGSGGDNKTATVSAVREGTATITARAKDGSGKEAKCVVTVQKALVEATSLGFTIDDDQKNAKDLNKTWQYTAVLKPDGATVDKVEWKSSNEAVATVTPVEADAAIPVTGLVKRGTQPGKTTITVTVTSGTKVLTDAFDLVISGITMNKPTLSVTVGKTETLAVTKPGFGEAVGQAIEWRSERGDIASVTGSGGDCVVTGRSQGTTKITATTKDGQYLAECVVTVSEDTSGLIRTANVAAGRPLNMATAGASTVFDVNNPGQPSYSGTVASVLNSLAQHKYQSPLSYVTNLSVPTAQGVLYYGYVSEADPGAGVGGTEQYYVSGAQGLLALNQVSFVPRATTTGSVDISYTAWTASGQAFSGIIRVPVSGTGASGGIAYSASGEQPARFQSADFEAVCMARTGRGLDYVTFYLPSSAYGTLYYGYVGGYGERVSADTQYRSYGSNRLDNVSFVPAQGYSGTVIVSYRAYPQGGTPFTGQVTINASAQSGQGLVNYSGSKLAPVYFQAGDFSMACYTATNEMLSYVRFQLPPASQGTLYYNYYGGSYNTPVSAGTNYYRNGTPGIGSVCFVPAATASDTVSIPFTGIGVNGASFAGTVLIRLNGYGPGVAQNIQYTAYKGKPAALQANDFNSASISATGAALNYVQFQLPSYNQGTLYYNYYSGSSYGNQVYSGTSYYYTGGGYQNLIGNISFVAASNFTGVARFNYTGYAINGQSFTGSVSVQVSDPSPSDVNYSSSNASPIRLSSATLRNACNPVLSRELSYIEITGLPASTLGQLYANYSGFGSGTLANVGGRYYCSGNPSIDQLYFVPRGGAQGTATVTYTGYSTTGERVNGRINFNLSSSGTSRYFTDMGKHAWAAAAVDYLYANDVTNGVAPGQYGPNRKMLRRDFVLMLCRAFDFTGGSGYSFADVPTNAYYANAVATAKRLGIVNGDGVNFRPNSSLTRQDAMVMIKNALTAAGWNLGNGSSVDLSRFVDSREVASYARDAVGTLVRLGAVNGDNRGRLNPRGDITRAEIAVILHFVMTM